MPDYSEEEIRELDRLAQEEAAERGEQYVSPFDDAAAAAAPQSSEPESEQLAFGEVPKPRSHAKKGRKSVGGKRGRPKKETKAPPAAPRSHSAQVKGPPAPPVAADPAAPPMVPPIPSAQLVPLLKRLDKRIASRIGTEKLSAQELSEGAEAFSQLLHHYLPVALNQPWAPFAAWALLAYGPRMLDRDDPEEREPAASAQESAPSSATFRTPDAQPVAPPAAPDITSDAVAPVFRNPMVDMPDAPATGFPR